MLTKKYLFLFVFFIFANNLSAEEIQGSANLSTHIQILQKSAEEVFPTLLTEIDYLEVRLKEIEQSNKIHETFDKLHKVDKSKLLDTLNQSRLFKNENKQDIIEVFVTAVSTAEKEIRELKRKLFSSTQIKQALYPELEIYLTYQGIKIFQNHFNIALEKESKDTSIEKLLSWKKRLLKEIYKEISLPSKTLLYQALDIDTTHDAFFENYLAQKFLLSLKSQLMLNVEKTLSEKNIDQETFHLIHLNHESIYKTLETYSKKLNKVDYNSLEDNKELINFLNQIEEEFDYLVEVIVSEFVRVNQDDEKIKKLLTKYQELQLADLNRVAFEKKRVLSRTIIDATKYTRRKLKKRRLYQKNKLYSGTLYNKSEENQKFILANKENEESVLFNIVDFIYDRNIFHAWNIEKKLKQLQISFNWKNETEQNWYYDESKRKEISAITYQNHLLFFPLAKGIKISNPTFSLDQKFSIKSIHFYGPLLTKPHIEYLTIKSTSKKIHFSLTRQRGSYEIKEIEKIPPEIPLKSTRQQTTYQNNEGWIDGLKFYFNQKVVEQIQLSHKNHDSIPSMHDIQKIRKLHPQINPTAKLINLPTTLINHFNKKNQGRYYRTETKVKIFTHHITISKGYRNSFFSDSNTEGTKFIVTKSLESELKKGIVITADYGGRLFILNEEENILIEIPSVEQYKKQINQVLYELDQVIWTNQISQHWKSQSARKRIKENLQAFFKKKTNNPLITTLSLSAV